MRRDVLRLSDSGNRSSIRVLQEDDGDLWIVVRDDKGRLADAEFCTTHAGGGRSPRVRDALLLLMEAIEADNHDRPIH